jgi:hypothetical protein
MIRTEPPTVRPEGRDVETDRVALDVKTEHARPGPGGRKTVGAVTRHGGTPGLSVSKGQGGIRGRRHQ